MLEWEWEQDGYRYHLMVQPMTRRVWFEQRRGMFTDVVEGSYRTTGLWKEFLRSVVTTTQRKGYQIALNALKSIQERMD